MLGFCQAWRRDVAKADKIQTNISPPSTSTTAKSLVDGWEGKGLEPWRGVGVGVFNRQRGLQPSLRLLYVLKNKKCMYRIPLETEKIYHIYNRGINGENLFREERNYRFFMKRYAHYLGEAVDTFAYCLLKNHFHLLVRVKSVAERTQIRQKPSVKGANTILLDPSRQFGHLFNSYTQAINKAYGRTGSLFEESFARIHVDENRYFTNLINYIHTNPVKHGFTDDFTDYRHSSYQSHLSSKPSKLEREEVLEWFGGRQDFSDFHDTNQTNKAIEKYILAFDISII